MTEPASLARLADLLLAKVGLRTPKSRLLVGIAGPPGSGKSTTAEALEARINADVPGLSAILPMDGYHFDDRLLVPRGDRPRKGAPHTFDLGGFAAMIRRLEADDGSDIAVPVFDRGLEIARAGARIIAGKTRIILVEGNYVLLDAEGWRDLAPVFDVTIMVRADETVLEARLRERWAGLDPAAMTEKMDANDIPNMRLVLQNSLPAQYVLDTDAGTLDAQP